MKSFPFPESDIFLAHRTRHIISSMIESSALIFSPESAKVTLFFLKKKKNTLLFFVFFQPSSLEGKKERGKIKKIPDML